MIAKKIPNPKKSTSKASRAIGLTDYIREPERENGIEKCIHAEAENFLTNDAHSQSLEMIALSSEAVRSADPIDHWVLSWREGERPTVEQAREAVKMFIEHCELNGHQYIWGLHDDTENLHIHVAVNRVNPDTLKVTKINGGFDLNAAHQAVALIEARQGWTPEKNARFHTDEHGQLNIDAKTKRPALSSSKENKLPQKIIDKEVQTGEKSAARQGIETAPQIIQQATSWKELHAGMEAAGMIYDRKGSGAVIYINGVPVKASDIDRKATLSALEKKLGTYQPSKEINQNDYYHHRQDRLEEYSGIGADRTSDTQKSNVTTPRKNTGHMLRNMSECRLAHDKTGAAPTRAGVLQLDACPGGRSITGLRRDTGHSAGDSTSRRIEPMQEGHGWQEYLAIRDTMKVEKMQAADAMRKAHDAERTALFEKQQASRKEKLTGDWKGKGQQRNALSSQIAIDQAAAKRELQERQRDERAAFYSQYAPLPQYKDWKDEPAILDSTENVRKKILQREEEERLSVALRNLKQEAAGQRGHFTYRSNGIALFRDEGRRLAIYDKSDKSLAVALTVAQQKFGNKMVITGTPEFRHKVVASAVNNNIIIKFADPELEALRVRLQAEKQLADRTAHQARSVADQAAETARIEADVEKGIQESMTRQREATALAAADALRKEQEAKAAALAAATEAAKIKEAKQLSEAGQLADIHQQIAATRASLPQYDANLTKPVDLAPDSRYSSGGGAIFGINDKYLAVNTGKKIEIFELEKLEKIDYDGTAEGRDMFAPGNHVEIKRSADGQVRVKISEEREVLQTEARRAIELRKSQDRGLFD